MFCFLRKFTHIILDKIAFQKYISEVGPQWKLGKHIKKSSNLLDLAEIILTSMKIIRKDSYQEKHSDSDDFAA